MPTHLVYEHVSVGAACENPGKRKLDLDPYGDILPNGTEYLNTDLRVDAWMDCATTPDENGCHCNITTRAYNTDAGSEW